MISATREIEKLILTVYSDENLYDEERDYYVGVNIGMVVVNALKRLKTKDVNWEEVIEGIMQEIKYEI